MKKWLTGIIVFLMVLMACMYLLIPTNFFVRQSLSIQVNSKGFDRTILDDKIMEQWWPGPRKDDTINYKHENFYFNGNNYKITEKKMNSIVFSVTNLSDSANAELNFIATKPDSVKLIWTAQMNISTVPTKRLQDYFKARKLKNDLNKLLVKLKSFYSNQDNIYGMHIQKNYVVDSILVSTFDTSKGYPTTKFIYTLIDRLKKYIAANSAVETGFPMVNISTADSISFFTRVAIPVNKKLNSSGDISYKLMPGGGNILITEVKGGQSAINEAFDQIENYVTDHGRVAPAIPYQSLITNRMQVQDSSKWITKIYYPVM